MPSSLVITNDDGLESPFAEILIQTSKKVFPNSKLGFVFPDQERSWISQAITRRGLLNTTPLTISEVDGFSCSGTPADCANLAIDNLFDTKPALVISGINVGVNAGVPYYQYSGTIGAARAASLREVKAIALSLSVPKDIYALWHEKDMEALAKFSERFSEITQRALELSKELLDDGFWEDADLYSINLPWDTNSSTPVRIGLLEPMTVNQVFSKVSDGVYNHNFMGINQTTKDEGCDYTVVKNGSISIMPIKYYRDSFTNEKSLEKLNKLIGK